MSGEVGFVELGVEDVERGRAFYQAMFGWRWRWPASAASSSAATTRARASVSTSRRPGGRRGAGALGFRRSAQSSQC